MDTTVIVVDARSREQLVFTASATTIFKTGIILRKGVDVGNVRNICGQIVEHPILVVGSYTAKVSAGYTCQIGIENFDSKIWIGGAGFGVEDDAGKKHGFGLRPFGWPILATLIPAGAQIESVETHGNSNCATANAAFTGLCLQVKANPNIFILVEGQSDYTSATRFIIPSDAVLPEFSEEHRLDIFSSEKILEAGIRRMVGHQDENRKGRIALRYALLNTIINLNKGVKEANIFMATLPKNVCDFLGDEEIKRLVEKRYTKLLEEGWRFGFDMNLTNHFTKTIAPDGTETQGNALCSDKKVEALFLALATANTEAEMLQMKTSEISSILSRYFWGSWAINDHLSDNDFLVEAEFANGESEKIWFANGERKGPNGEESKTSRFLCAFDNWDPKCEQYLWPRLLELRQMIITAYEPKDGGEKVESREWFASESDSPYVNR
jgi:hypothetical protein